MLYQLPINAISGLWESGEVSFREFVPAQFPARTRTTKPFLRRLEPGCQANLFAAAPSKDLKPPPRRDQEEWPTSPYRSRNARSKLFKGFFKGFLEGLLEASSGRVVFAGPGLCVRGCWIRQRHPSRAHSRASVEAGESRRRAQSNG